MSSPEYGESQIVKQGWHIYRVLVVLIGGDPSHMKANNQHLKPRDLIPAD